VPAIVPGSTLALFAEREVPPVVCPGCRAGLKLADVGSLWCRSCGRSYLQEGGIPILLTDYAKADHDEIHHAAGHKHKEQQAEYFDADIAREFELARPHGSPRLYGWVLERKFRESLAGLSALSTHPTVLTVCGGSGMDAEFLARKGAAVTLTDISSGAVHRARERSQRYGFPLVPIVADVERLPFADRSFELVYVHDGLHHLVDPLTGLREMARVARKGISVNEPVDARVTAVAARFGLALTREDAGNVVARLSPERIVAALDAEGFHTTLVRRYVMYYPHEPRAMYRILSGFPLYQLVKVLYFAVNTLLGRFGNKVTIQAIRMDPMRGET
jgi:ubiquinone/menaquinone biosynthesis C-methylase UbiE/uncharacterized protein YbaR (Trm112 family)